MDSNNICLESGAEFNEIETVCDPLGWIKQEVPDEVIEDPLLATAAIQFINEIETSGSKRTLPKCIRGKKRLSRSKTVERRKKMEKLERRIKNAGGEQVDGIWSCKKCPYKHTSGGKLLEHLLRAHGNEKNKNLHRDGTSESTGLCKECNYEFPSESSLKRHIDYLHTKERAARSKVTEDLTLATIKIEKELGTAPLEKLTKAEKTKRKKEKKIKRELKRLEAKILKKQVEEWEEEMLKECGKQDEVGSWWCFRCGTRFIKTHNFIYHLNRIHNIKIGNFEYKCPHCDMDFRENKSLKTHMICIHYKDPKESPGKKKAVNKVVKKSATVGLDVVMEHGKRDKYGTWLCNNCSAMYEKKSQFIIHLKKAHNICIKKVT